MDTAETQLINRTLVKLARLYRAAQTESLAELGLHPGQEVLIWTLGQAPEGLLVNELAERLGVESPTVTRSLARLDPDGWFTRTPEATDRRAVRVRLTTRARNTLAGIECAWRSLAETATAGLNSADREQLLTLLQQVQNNLRTLAAPDAELPDAAR